MLIEQNFLQDQIATLRKRLALIQLPENAQERMGSAKLVKAYEIRNKAFVNLKNQLVEILGMEDAQVMAEEVERDADAWWRTSRIETIENPIRP